MGQTSYGWGTDQNYVFHAQAQWDLRCSLAKPNWMCGLAVKAWYLFETSFEVARPLIYLFDPNKYSVGHSPSVTLQVHSV